MKETLDVAVIGAGASGLMCAAQAGLRNRRVLVLDHGRPGRKILMAGGGRCNFTNLRLGPEHYISANPHFCKSALSRFTPGDFLTMVTARGIPYEERDHGQLFCKESSARILGLLLDQCRRTGVKISAKTRVKEIKPRTGAKGFQIQTQAGVIQCASLVIATGGISMPKAGATDFGYRTAKQFGMDVVPPRPGLVPFTLGPKDKKRLAPLSGIAVDAQVACPKAVFRENLLFTHQGLSGPVILQASNYLAPGQPLTIDLLPSASVEAVIRAAQGSRPGKQVRSILSEHLPKRVVEARLDRDSGSRPVRTLSENQVRAVAQAFHQWEITPCGTQGFQKAEVTLGGVDCCGISSKTMEARHVPGLYFIGEVLDVTGWLGGYNLQWAWSSGWCAGQYA